MATINFKDCIGSERRRGFQPPWYTVLIYKCPDCGRKRCIKKNWEGAMPPGAFKCGCKEES